MVNALKYNFCSVILPYTVHLEILGKWKLQNCSNTHVPDALVTMEQKKKRRFFGALSIEDRFTTIFNIF